jgi:hypothetical protein
MVFLYVGDVFRWNEKTTCSCKLPEIYFYDLEKSGTFGVPYLNLRGAGLELFKSLESETVWGGKTVTNGIPVCWGYVSM